MGDLYPLSAAVVPYTIGATLLNLGYLLTIVLFQRHRHLDALQKRCPAFVTILSGCSWVLNNWYLLGLGANKGMYKGIPCWVTTWVNNLFTPLWLYGMMVSSGWWVE